MSKESIKLEVKTKAEEIGPPKILQYKPEKKVTKPAKSSGTPVVDSKPEIDDVASYMQTYNVSIEGGRTCEFCSKITKPWPTIKTQEEIEIYQVLNFCLIIFISTFIN